MSRVSPTLCTIPPCFIVFTRPQEINYVAKGNSHDEDVPHTQWLTLWKSAPYSTWERRPVVQAWAEANGFDLDAPRLPPPPESDSSSSTDTDGPPPPPPKKAAAQPLPGDGRTATTAPRTPRGTASAEPGGNSKFPSALSQEYNDNADREAARNGGA